MSLTPRAKKDRLAADHNAIPSIRTNDMSTPDYSRFLSECIIHDPNEQLGLREDEMYGCT